MVQRHLRVGRVQRADVHVVKPALAAQEHLAQRPAPSVPACLVHQPASRPGVPGFGPRPWRPAWRRGPPRPRGPRRRPRAPPAVGDPLCVARAVAPDHGGELVPVDGPEVVVPAFVVPAQVRVGQGDAELLGLRHGHVDEALPQFVVGVPLDPPGHRLGGVRRLVVGRPEHHQRRPPEPVGRVLHHLPLRPRAAHHRHQQLVALPLVERLLLADADHRPGVRAVGRAAQRHLVADGGAVDQPADHADVGVGQRRVVEDRGVLLPAADQPLGQVGPVGAEGLGRRVQVHAVTGLVLHLGEQDGLAAQRRGAGDPVALWLHADDLRVRVLRDLPDHRRPVAVGHPVPRLDPPVARDRVVEVGLEVVRPGPRQAGHRLHCFATMVSTSYLAATEPSCLVTSASHRTSP